MSGRVTRNQVVAMFGTPDHTDGSLNSPIEFDDDGIHYNEKWTYSHLDADPTGVSVAGSWLSSTASSGFYGSDYLHNNNTNKGLDSVTFTPNFVSR